MKKNIREQKEQKEDLLIKIPVYYIDKNGKKINSTTKKR